MIEFHKLTLSQKEDYEHVLFSCPPRGCEYSFANLFLWGRQQAAWLHGCVAFFSHFYGRSVYPYPIGTGDRRAVLEEILADSRQRGIPCRITNVLESDRAELEQWFPGQFLFRSDRDGFDYVYAADDLADLRGRKFQKKRNHFNRFRSGHPDYEILPLCPQPLPPHFPTFFPHRSHSFFRPKSNRKAMPLRLSSPQNAPTNQRFVSHSKTRKHAQPQKFLLRSHPRGCFLPRHLV